ncbi:MAG: hypothetical protein WD638_08145 [Nitriliruptoraceae bacterium]
MKHPWNEGARTVGRLLLGVFLLLAGLGHLLVPEEFLGQVPTWLPARVAIVYVSGVVEVGLGGALIGLRRRRVALGWLVAAFFVLVLPGNIHQALAGTEAFGLRTDAARWGRLFFQPLLVAWALWATGAWTARKRTQPRA